MCQHCSRGEAQNVSMSEEVLYKALDNIGIAFTLALTGGEPFLEPDIIEKMVDYIIENKIRIYDFTTTENGTILDEKSVRCIKALNRLGAYITSEMRKGGAGYNEKAVRIVISNDIFHANNPEEAVDFYRQYVNEYVSVEIEKDAESQNDLKNLSWLICEGRAETNFPNWGRKRWEKHRIEFEEEPASIKCPIQITVDGNVQIACDCSYEKSKQLYMGNIFEEDIYDIILNWNRMNIMSCYEVNLALQQLNGDGEKRELTENQKMLLYIHHLKEQSYDYVAKHYPYLSLVAQKELGLAIAAREYILQMDKNHAPDEESALIQFVWKSANIECEDNRTIKDMNNIFLKASMGQLFKALGTIIN